MNNIQQGLLIAAIGMGLVFVVIIFLWGLMALMMRITSREKKLAKPESSSIESDAPLVPEMQVAEGQRRAAAAAVAVELAIAASRTHRTQARQGDFTDGVSPWQVFHRSRQLQHKNARG